MEIEGEERETDRKLINCADVGCTRGKQVIMSSSHKWPLCPSTLSLCLSLALCFTLIQIFMQRVLQIKKHLRTYLRSLAQPFGFCLRFWLYSIS